jgi:hypothetical protein
LQFLNKLLLPFKRMEMKKDLEEAFEQILRRE